MNQFQTRHFETITKVIDWTASIETRRRESEYPVKGNIQREREKKREGKKKKDNLDRSYNHYAFREATVR